MSCDCVVSKECGSYVGGKAISCSIIFLFCLSKNKCARFILDFLSKYIFCTTLIPQRGQACNLNIYAFYAVGELSFRCYFGQEYDPFNPRKRILMKLVCRYKNRRNLAKKALRHAIRDNLYAFVRSISCGTERGRVASIC